MTAPAGALAYANPHCGAMVVQRFALPIAHPPGDAAHMTYPIDDVPAFHPPAGRALKFDATINIPTIVMLVGMLVGGAAALVGAYNNVVDRMQSADTNLLQRITNNDGEIRVLKSEAATARVARDQDRQELQANLHDMNIKLDQLLWDRGNRAPVRGNAR